jgi:hypothetical protein
MEALCKLLQRAFFIVRDNRIQAHRCKKVQLMSRVSIWSTFFCRQADSAAAVAARF